jgi:uncharacterized protein
MKLVNEILATLPEGKTLEVRIGLHWTAVVVEVDGERRCGLATTIESAHEHHGEPDVPTAGALLDMPTAELAALSHREGTLASVGVAAINALMPQNPESWVDINAEHVIAEHGEGKIVGLVGDFPFVGRLRERVGELHVIDKRDHEGTLPENAAAEIFPKAGVVAITGMSLINHTLEQLLGYCNPEAKVIVLGPSTPLSPVFYEYGVDLLSGSIVTDIESVLRAVAQGANFRQVHRAGVRLVTVQR